jgi:hypothetical protein
MDSDTFPSSSTSATASAIRRNDNGELAACDLLKLSLSLNPSPVRASGT